MKKFIIRHILPVFLCVILVVPLFSSSASASLLSQVSAYLSETTFFNNVTEQKLKSALLNFLNGTSGVDYGQYWCSNYWAKNHYHEVSYSSLVELADKYNTSYSAFSYPVQIMQVPGMELFGLRFLYATSDGISSICWIADSNGTALFAPLDSVSGNWKSIQHLSPRRYVVPYSILDSLAAENHGYVRQSGDWFFVFNSSHDKIYHTADGLPYAAIANKDSAAINQDRETTSGTVTEGGTTTNITNENNDYSHNIDIENMTQVLPGGTVNNIDSLIYDAATKTYYSNSYYIDQSDNRTYNFTVNQYHINYTSITYIGQTVEYEKHYELYYQLPDGRDSADLTASDLEQISTSFKDVMNYARSADDLNQRVLYHFDGNTEDSSYWSYCTDFHWEIGASLTYMDEGVFDGSLYLDETRHRFSITLPGAADLAGDWTLQFRYYQSHTLTPLWDSGIWVGEIGILHLNGTNLGTHGIDAGPISVGSWNEICLMRKDGIVYYYLNGVCVTSQEKAVSGNVLLFDFGTVQQTYKKIDELRFTRGAIYTPGETYTPTSVPYDSNLTLVLPDSRIPVADEVMKLTPSASNLFNSPSMNSWVDGASVNALGITRLPSSWSDYIFGVSPVLHYNPTYTSFSSGSGSTRMSVTSDISTFETSYFESDYNITQYMQFGSGLFYSLGGYVQNRAEDGGWDSPVFNNILFDIPTTVSVVLADGSYSTATFVYRDYKTLEFLSKDISSPIDFEFVDLYSDSDYYWTDTYHRLGLRIYPRNAASVDIIYMEWYYGNGPGFSITYEGAVYDPVQLTESPVLAVRSNLPITTYQIGGVRPSYPQKGQVYAMVERGYITSLQQYTGSAWEAVDGRIWTGSRWIPFGSYNVITLQDMYDIVDSTPDYEYIYSESGFWDWFQRAWKDLLARLDKIIDGQGSGSDCQHVYESRPDKEPTCTDPGHIIYTCTNCGHTYTELIDPLGHDWIVTNTVPPVLDETGSVKEKGYDELKCSRCDLISKDYGDGPIETDLFEALGDLIAEGISRVLDKLTELVDALTGITESFNGFVEKIGALIGAFPLFFAAFFVLIPEDLATVLWFGVVSFVVLAVWRKWSK